MDAPLLKDVIDCLNDLALTNSSSFPFSILNLQLCMLQQLVAERFRAEHVQCLSNRLLYPNSIFQTRVGPEHVIQVPVLLKGLDGFVVELHEIFIVVFLCDARDLSELRKSVLRRKEADFLEDGVQIFVTGSDEVVRIFATLLKHSVELFSLVRGVALAEQQTVQDQGVLVDLTRRLPF